MWFDPDTKEILGVADVLARGISASEESDLSAFGLPTIIVTPKPGDGYTLGEPEEIGGVLHTTWVEPPPPPLEDLKSEKQAALAAEYQSRVQSYPHDFGAPHGVLHLQLRGTDDQANWLTLQAKAMNLIAAGQGDAEVLAIRTEENITVPVTANVAAQVMDALSSFGGATLAHKWALKDAINAAEDEQALEAIDIEAGWPA